MPASCLSLDGITMASAIMALRFLLLQLCSHCLFVNGSTKAILIIGSSPSIDDEDMALELFTETKKKCGMQSKGNYLGLA